MSKDGPDLVRASKLLSLVLRHDPGALGLSLDPEGWVSVQELVVNSDGRLTDALVRQIVRESDKQRFALSEDGSKIRANQGHSLDVNLGLQPTVPPETLFHGTAAQCVKAITAEGLKPGNRQFVHLSADMETAQKVGSRHGRAVVLTIDAAGMQKSGSSFFRSENGVWLTRYVPVE
ncbi:MAG: RNA 2'-phosphotransferase, partial [Albidovulum sp.]